MTPDKILAALVLATAPAAAQEVAGVLVDPSGQPVRAAVVQLVDSAGVRHAAGLTDERGEFRLRGATAGRFAVRAERVGYQPTRSALLPLEVGATRPLRLTASAASITLEGITVRPGRRCEALSSSEVAPIWEEARKALAATEQAARSAQGRYRVVRYRQERDPSSLTVWGDQRSEVLSSSARAFRSIRSDSLLGGGFVAAEGDSVTWYAPDAEILLSDPFLATHCFAAVAHPDSAGLVGLRFQPVPGRRMPEVSGTLWLHRRTAALRFLEYGYVNACEGARHRRVGGRVEFAQLPSGLWIVARWWIRLPLLGQRQTVRLPTRNNPTPQTQRTEVRSLIEVGGEVHVATAPSTTPAGRIRGTVWDSLSGGPLVGARVYLSGSTRSVHSGPGGAFEFGDLPDGIYTVSFTHPTLDATGVPPVPRQVTLAGGETGQVALQGPSAATIVVTRCGTEGDPGAIFGVVPDGAGAVAAVEWQRVGRRLQTVSRARQEATVGADGRFVLCGLELEKPLDLTVTRGDRQHRQRVTMTRRVEFLRVELGPR